MPELIRGGQSSPNRDGGLRVPPACAGRGTKRALVGFCPPVSLELLRLMRTKAVIFDVDGTLIDTNALHSAAWVEAFQHFGVKVDLDDVRRQMGKGGDQLMPSFLPPDLVEQKGPAIERFRVDLFKRKYLPQARAFPGVRELFERTPLAKSQSGGKSRLYFALWLSKEGQGSCFCPD